MPLSDLTRFRDDTEVEIHDPVIDHASKLQFRDGRVLGFDQSLRNTGWSLVKVTDGIPVVELAGVVQTEAMSKKVTEDTLMTAESLAVQYAGVLQIAVGVGQFRVAHEMPTKFGKRTDASLVAAVALRVVLVGHAYPEATMHSVQKIKGFLTGNNNADKAEVRRAVEVWITERPKRWNEAIVDATAVALKELEYR